MLPFKEVHNSVLALTIHYKPLDGNDASAADLTFQKLFISSFMLFNFI